MITSSRNFIFACLGIVCILALVVLRPFPSHTVSPPQSVEEGHSDVWAAYIRIVGSKEAYQHFSDVIRGQQPNQQHAAAHVFGAALFSAEGKKGLATCDSQYSFGCFHEFLGRAIKDLGLAVVPELNAGCREVLAQTYLSCQHGIGHGVLAFLGYDDEAIFKALTVCSELPDADVIGGCYGGVFMEYNLRTMWGVSAMPRSPEKGVHFPCNAVDKQFVTACYFWQPQWWSMILRDDVPKKDREERFRDIGKYCVESLDRRHCFEGIGNILLSESHDTNGRPSPDTARRLCAVSAHNERDNLFCLSQVANHFGLEVSQEAASIVCQDLKGPSRVYCEQYGRNEANIANVPPLPSDI